jgi:membrane protease subunit HflK
MSSETPGILPQRNGKGRFLKNAAGKLRSVLKHIMLFFKLRVRESAAKDGSALNDLVRAFGHLNPKKAVLLLALGVFTVYMLTGIYMVNPGEQAVIKRFGKVLPGTISEGLHYRLPSPVDEARKVNIAEVRRADIGMNIPEHLHQSGDIPQPIQLLTGDENIIASQAIVHYRVKDAAAYLFNINSNSEQLVRFTVEAALVQLMARTAVDDILSTEKAAAQNFIIALAQNTLDRSNAGIQITAFNIQAIIPPDTVAEAFRAVTAAREEKETAVNRAQGYYNSLLPNARAQANKMLTEAESYKTRQINRAAGDSEKFLGMLAEYQNDGGNAARNITRYRLLAETLERTLPKAKLYIIDSRDNSVDVRLLEQGMTAGVQAAGRTN